MAEGADPSIRQTLWQEEEITFCFLSQSFLFSNLLFEKRRMQPPLPCGCLVWGLVSVCCDSWGSHESIVDSLAPPPAPPPTLGFLTSFTPICHCGPRSGLLVQCEVSLSPAVTPHFIDSSPACSLGGQAPMCPQHSDAAVRDVHHSGNVAFSYHLINTAVVAEVCCCFKNTAVCQHSCYLYLTVKRFSPRKLNWFSVWYTPPLCARIF